jgi:hypothetical protein
VWKQFELKSFVREVQENLLRGYQLNFYFTLVAFVAVLFGVVAIGVGTVELEKEARCGGLMRTDAVWHDHANFTLTIGQYLEMNSSIPHGVIEVVWDDDATAAKASSITATAWALDGAVLPPAGWLRQSGVLFQTPRGWGLNLEPLVGLGKADHECLAMKLSITVPAHWTQFNSYIVHSDHMMLNFTSDEAKFGRAGALVNSFEATTVSAPIHLWVVEALADVSAHSHTGDIQLYSMRAVGITAETSGDILSRRVASFSLTDFSSTEGDVHFTAHGNGEVIMTSGLGGYNIFVSTENGNIVGVDCGVLNGLELSLVTHGGDIYTTNFLAASGNHTTIYTHSGNIKGASLVANTLDMTALHGKIALVELFVGILTPDSGYEPPVPEYATPLINLHSLDGDINILGLGGSPYDDQAAKAMSVSITTDIADVSVEVNGGGFEGCYDVHSGGDVLVEIVGAERSHTGCIGNGAGYFNVTSNQGAVDWILLPSPF